jgi:hypothetical protein
MILVINGLVDPIAKSLIAWREFYTTKWLCSSRPPLCTVAYSDLRGDPYVAEDILPSSFRSRLGSPIGVGTMLLL